MYKYFPVSLVTPLFTLSLITSLLISPLLFINSSKVSAANFSNEAPPVSAPPEPFIIPQHTLAENVIPAVSSYLEKLGDFVKGPKVPEGFEIIQPPSLMERIGVSLGFIAPKASTAINMTAAPPPPPTQPGAAVDFDFDGDGKSDIGRWHSANKEFKIRNSNGGSYSTYTVGTSTAQIPAPADYS